MRLVTGISIVLLAVLVALMVACAEKPLRPIFTENEIEKLIRYSQGDYKCFQNFVTFHFADNEYQPITTREESKAGHPSQTFEYSFKPDGRWFVDVTTSWKIEERYLDKNPRPVDFSTGYFMSENKDQIELNCIYLVNEKTAKVTFKGERATIQGN